MDKKYILDSKENREFLSEGAKSLLEFGRNYPSPKGSSYYLGSDGTPIKERNRETWITARMVHVYAIGKMLGFEWCSDLAEAGLKGLIDELRDKEKGGWYAGLTSNDEIVPGKQCYAHAFVILAASSALLAGIKGAEALLSDALNVFESRFYDEKEGMALDGWDTLFTVPDDYRGLNANMHTVEAFLAAADALSDEKYRIRAGRIIDRTLVFAKNNGYRLPEHYTKDWVPEIELNKDRPDDPFKPYGATPGHGIEWARLITEWCLSTFKGEEGKEKRDHYIREASALYDRAVSDGWNSDGAPGIVYTTGWDGKPVVSDRMHWTLAEAINTSAVLYRTTGDEKYASQYASFLQYLDEFVLDHSTGSWFHQLDNNNVLKETVWPGKPDIYHAFQAMLIPYAKTELSIAKAVSLG